MACSGVRLCSVPSAIPSGAPPHARAAYLLARVGRTHSVRFAERMRSIGLRPKHFAVLNAIALSDGASQQEIGGHTGRGPGGLVGADHELARPGLVAPPRGPGCRRPNAPPHRTDRAALPRRTPPPRPPRG